MITSEPVWWMVHGWVTIKHTRKAATAAGNQPVDKDPAFCTSTPSIRSASPVFFREHPRWFWLNCPQNSQFILFWQTWKVFLLREVPPALKSSLKELKRGTPRCAHAPCRKKHTKLTVNCQLVKYKWCSRNFTGNWRDRHLTSPPTCSNTAKTETCKKASVSGKTTDRACQIWSRHKNLGCRSQL